MAFTKDQLAELKKVHGTKPLFRLRWCFHYNDGKPSRRGIWNGATGNPKDMASFVDKKNLSSVVIEAEYVGNYSIHRLLEVDGQDYASMSWVMGASVPMFFKEQKIIRRGMVLGLSIFTREELISVFIDGSRSARVLSKNEKQFKLTEYKR